MKLKLHILYLSICAILLSNKTLAQEDVGVIFVSEGTTTIGFSQLSVVNPLSKKTFKVQTNTTSEVIYIEKGAIITGLSNLFLNKVKPITQVSIKPNEQQFVVSKPKNKLKHRRPKFQYNSPLGSLPKGLSFIKTSAFTVFTPTHKRVKHSRAKQQSQYLSKDLSIFARYNSKAIVVVTHQNIKQYLIVKTYNSRPPPAV